MSNDLLPEPPEGHIPCGECARLFDGKDNSDVVIRSKNVLKQWLSEGRLRVEDIDRVVDEIALELQRPKEGQNLKVEGICSRELKLIQKALSELNSRIMKLATAEWEEFGAEGNFGELHRFIGALREKLADAKTIVIYFKKEKS